jgi:hypothetical protein
MPYNLNNFDGRSFTTIEDGVVDRQSSSSLNFVGKDVTGYGEIQNENFLFLLENFAGQNAPVNKIQGQIWFDKTGSVMKPKIWDGSRWKIFSMVDAQSTEPTYSQLGDFWFDTTNEQLYVKNSLTYSLIGPEKIPGFDRTQLKSVSILDTGSVEHACIVMYADGNVIGVISFDSFNVKSTEAIYAAGITRVGSGITLVNGSGVNTDTVYAAPALNETIAGNWTFNGSQGVSIGSSKLYTTSSNFYIESLSDIILKASNVLPYGTTALGSANNKFSKIFTSEISGGTSLSTVNLTGQFTLGASSKISPATDGGISLGANNAKWSSVFTKAINAGGSASTGDIIGNWTLEGSSVLDVSQGTFKTDTLSTGDAVTAGTITGAWTLTDDSSLTLETGNLTLDTGNLDVTLGTVLTKEISSGDISTRGTLTGDWNLFSGSQFDATQGTFKSRSLNAGNAGTTATITGNWSLTTNSILDVTNGSLRSKSLTTGDASTVGDMIGYWSLGTGSSLDVRNGTFYTDTLDTSGAVGSINGDWRLASGKTFDVTSGTFRTTTLNAGSTATVGTIIGNWSVGAGSSFNLGSVNFVTRTLNAGSTTTTGTVTGDWRLSAGSKLSSTYADLAEYYTSDQEYEPVTVVSIDLSDNYEVSISSVSNDTAVAGIVTTNPAYVMNDNLEGTKVCIALAGRVPCKAVGPITKGNLLVTSTVPGHVKSCSNFEVGIIVGKALSSLADGEVGVIEVMVVRG